MIKEKGIFSDEVMGESDKCEDKLGVLLENAVEYLVHFQVVMHPSKKDTMGGGGRGIKVVRKRTMRSYNHTSMFMLLKSERRVSKSQNNT